MGLSLVNLMDWLIDYGATCVIFLNLAVLNNILLTWEVSWKIGKLLSVLLNCVFSSPMCIVFVTVMPLMTVNMVLWIYSFVVK